MYICYDFSMHVCELSNIMSSNKHSRRTHLSLGPGFGSSAAHRFMLYVLLKPQLPSPSSSHQFIVFVFPNLQINIYIYIYISLILFFFFPLPDKLLTITTIIIIEKKGQVLSNLEKSESQMLHGWANSQEPWRCDDLC